MPFASVGSIVSKTHWIWRHRHCFRWELRGVIRLGQWPRPWHHTVDVRCRVMYSLVLELFHFRAPNSHRNITPSMLKQRQSLNYFDTRNRLLYFRGSRCVKDPCMGKKWWLKTTKPLSQEKPRIESRLGLVWFVIKMEIRGVIVAPITRMICMVNSYDVIVLNRTVYK